MSDRVMLDPSLILHAESITELLFLAESGQMSGVAVPGQFVELHREPDFLSSLRAFYGYSRKGDDRLVDLLFLMAEGQIEPYFNDKSLDLFASSTLADSDPEWLLRLLAQEHAFLLNESWIFSKVRRVFDRMIEVGATAVETSKDRFDVVVRRTLKKGPGEDLTTNERLRAASKWTAVSGPAVLALFEPVSGAVVSSAAGLFLLADP